MSGAVELGYEINTALGKYLDATDYIDRQRAKLRLLQILWDNKAGIVAHLLDGRTISPADHPMTKDTDQ